GPNSTTPHSYNLSASHHAFRHRSVASDHHQREQHRPTLHHYYCSATLQSPHRADNHAGERSTTQAIPIAPPRPPQAASGFVQIFLSPMPGGTQPWRLAAARRRHIGDRALRFFANYGVTVGLNGLAVTVIDRGRSS